MPGTMQQQLTQITNSGNVLMLAWGAALVFSMHAGFAFLEAGSVRRKNVVNALTKIVMDWSVSTLVYFNHRLSDRLRAFPFSSR